jgi:hypothetical protein
LAQKSLFLLGCLNLHRLRRLKPRNVAQSVIYFTRKKVVYWADLLILVNVLKCAILVPNVLIVSVLPFKNSSNSKQGNHGKTVAAIAAKRASDAAKKTADSSVSTQLTPTSSMVITDADRLIAETTGDFHQTKYVHLVFNN